MFWLKRKSGVERKISHMHDLLARSFANVKKDTQHMFQWINFLHQKNQEQENMIKQLQVELSYAPKNHEEIKKIIDSHYAFDSIHERIKFLNEKVDGITGQGVSKVRTIPELHPEIHDIKKRLGNLEEQKQATIRDKVVKRVTRNSKEYVKSLMLSYIRKYGQIGALQLKDMVIHDQGLCSKSSFYRLLEEIEAMEEIGTVRKGRQKYYLFKQIREH